MKIVAIVQARMGSTRLPGKVLADLGGKPALARVLERAATIDAVDAVVLAIPDGREDDVLETVAGDCGVGVVRGDRDDVLARYQVAAAASAADAIVRITADCPILDPAISSRVVRAFVDERADYASNTRPPTFPDGYDTEVVSRGALDLAFTEARDPFEREHVLPFVWRRPERFALTNITGRVDRSSWRLTLDTAEDLDRLRRVWAALADQPMFGLAEVAALAEREPGILS